MDLYRQNVLEAAAFIRAECRPMTPVGVLTGTGLGPVVDAMQVEHTLEYARIPHFPLSTVPGHPGKLRIGKIDRDHLAVFQGRFHLYEGYSPREVTFPIRVMAEMGLRVLVVSNAAGGLNPGFRTGDLMLIVDHINLTGLNPLTGPNEETWGVRFPDMTNAYDRDLANAVRRAAERRRLRLQSGVYAGLQGPSLETPAEVRFLKTIGADAVGFSTVQEVICAVHAGLKVVGLSTITNVHDPENPQPATVEEIITAAEAAAPRIQRLIGSIMAELNGREDG
jgi:purine-nucleoside phosphorylase